MTKHVIAPVALTIAGSDSGGNAGVQADLRAFHVFGVHGCTVFAALTAQNPNGVRSVRVMDAAFVEDQLDAVFETYAVAAVKTGMLATADVIAAVAGRLVKQRGVAVVVDPVMVATSGAKLLQDDAVAALTEELLPRATLITPNIAEASILVGAPVTTRATMVAAARTLAAQFNCAILIKGGHAMGRAAVDVLCDGDTLATYQLPRIARPLSTHGTGCSLSAAITAALAKGDSLADAVAAGKRYVHDAICGAYRVGKRCAVLGTPVLREKDLNE